MSEIQKTHRPKRPEFRNINALNDLPGYRFPLAAIVSGMHRASGLILFLAMPFIIWMFDTSVGSEISFNRFASVFQQGVGPFPGGLVKLAALGLIWAYLHHFFAGIRHIRMDIYHNVSKECGRSTAVTTLILSLGLTVILGAKLFGLY
jgi:succinate dehydrogenase / fumarate reductase, cytochrome b subunit